MRFRAATLAAMALGLCGAATLTAPGVNRSVIDGDTMPAKLSEFGLFESNDPTRPRHALAYTLRTALFSDYAEKQRFIFLPAGTQARVEDDDRMVFPVGTVISKSFGWPDVDGGHPIETRLLIRRRDGWLALPYIWDADKQDATLALGGRRVPVTFQSPDGTRHSIRYAVPNKNQCKECHSENGAIEPIGPKARNFVMSPHQNSPAAHAAFANADALKATMPRWDDPKSGTVAERARAYLDVNCAHCHNPAGSASNSGLFLRWTDDPSGVNYGIGKRPTAAGRGGGGMDFAIAPAHPTQSFLLYRLESLDPGIAMPEVGRSTVHREGAKLLRQWIAVMPETKQ